MAILNPMKEVKQRDKLPLFSYDGDDQISFLNLLIEKEKLSPQ